MMYHTYYEHCVTIIVFHITFQKTTASIDKHCYVHDIVGLGLLVNCILYINIMFTNTMICGKIKSNKNYTFI